MYSGIKIVHFFKRHQRDGVYHYFEVHGGPGKTKNGYKKVINFLNPYPIIHVEHNYVNDPSGLTGTWCEFEVGIPISKEEYNKAFEKAINHPDCKIY